ncbi:flagellar basal body-associated FliL family protein [Vallicoccus soli]|uniref:Flagellar protein FliL n=1 Tax=Vallicoccus soli TaxID=2339232 RepID=A0A3A3YSU1_9ACTN|nr:flagellar basal body-associated FliL family protein [Vallicoccus soli]RJK92807.1 hypothetical protein D5H78_18315 [Vallicoccus soli]
MATTTKAPAADEAAEAPKKSKKMLFIVVGLVVVVVAAAAYFLLLKGGGEEEKEAEPVPGAVLVNEPITLNLADGHYLKVGLALQFTEEAGGGGHGASPDGSQALDRLIEQFSNRPVGELSSPESREKLKEHLLEEIKHDYHDGVMDIYFTEFVIQ